MNITITFEHADLIKHVRDMLATKGLQPEGEIEFRQQKGSKTYVVVVNCVPGPLLNECPMCQAKLNQGVPIPPRRSQKELHHEIQEEEGRAFVEAVQEAEREYPVNGTDEPQDPSIIDPELGETFDPPSPGEGAASVSVSKPAKEEEEENSGGSMASLLAANRRLTAERTRELEERKRQSGQASPSMAGESTKPPKPGEGV